MHSQSWVPRLQLTTMLRHCPHTGLWVYGRSPYKESETCPTARGRCPLTRAATHAVARCSPAPHASSRAAAEGTAAVPLIAQATLIAKYGVLEASYCVLEPPSASSARSMNATTASLCLWAWGWNAKAEAGTAPDVR